METKPRRTRKSPDDRRTEIAATARVIALEEGLDAVTQRAVAGRASMASALVAHYVESMDALVADTFSEIVAEEIREVRELVAAEPSATAGLVVLIDAALDPLRQDVTSLWVQAWS
ncbi:MAG: TetR family transcriptional regulator, partial [Agrococcus sp.]